LTELHFGHAAVVCTPEGRGDGAVGPSGTLGQTGGTESIGAVEGSGKGTPVELRTLLSAYSVFAPFQRFRARRELRIIGAMILVLGTNTSLTPIGLGRITAGRQDLAVVDTGPATSVIASVGQLFRTPLVHNRIFEDSSALRTLEQGGLAESGESLALSTDALDGSVGGTVHLLVLSAL